MINKSSEKQAGTFDLPSGKDIYGELTIDGRRTSLYLRDKDHFDTSDINGHCLKGKLHDFTKVTLIQCLTPPMPGHSSQGEDTYYFANIFPHFVASGHCHINPDEKKIIAVHFVIDDATTLFYDFDAFGIVTDASPLIEEIAHANKIGREIKTGPNPYILYFTGKNEIFTSDTALGRISASHRPFPNFSSPGGVGLKNTIFVTIAFREAVNFDDTIASLLSLLRYFEILIGRQQNLLDLYVDVECGNEHPASLHIYWSMSPKRKPSHNEEKPHPSDILLDPIRQSAAFSRVLGNWLEREQAWRDARLRFSKTFEIHDYYPIDRLIGSANMFDILPSSAVPPEVLLSEELKSANEECRKIFKELPQSLERDSILNALGRMGKSTLKHKIRHRGRLLIDIVGDRFPDLFMVTDQAVNCRNHYVHGSEPKFDYINNFDAVILFTDTLEFVFAASDLIDSGWDVKTWCQSGTIMSHPFSQYRVTYADRLKNLKNLMNNSGTDVN